MQFPGCNDMYIVLFLSRYSEFILKPMAISLLIMIIIKLTVIFFSKEKISKYNKPSAKITASPDEAAQTDIEYSNEKTQKSKYKVSKLLVLSVVLGISGLTGLIITEQMPAAPVGSVKYFVTQASSIGIIAFCLVVFGAIFWGRAPKTILAKIKILILSNLYVIFGAYIAIFLFMFVFQDTFIINNSFLFQPASISQEEANSYLRDNVKEIKLTTQDNVTLQGWFVKNSKKAKSPLVIYFGGSGSGSENSYMIDYAKKLDGWDVALIDYRGYGLSGGTPSEKGFMDDAVFLYDAFSKRDDIDSGKIVAMGYSLGANVAAIVSGKRKMAGTVLIAPSDNETHWFQRSCYPYIPYCLFRTKYFDAIQAAALTHSPLLCLIGEKDTNNPPDMAKNLVLHWAGEKTVVDYPTEDHKLLFHQNSSWEEIKIFLKKTT